MAARWTVAAVAAVGTALLAGCSSSTPQASTTLPPTSATPSASPTLPPIGPADLPVPPAAREKTRAGATLFNSYYVDLMTRTQASLDSEPLRDLSRGCENCTGLANTYDEMKAAGQHYEGGAFSIVSTGGTVINGDEAQTAFVLQEEASRVKNASGADVAGRSHPMSRYTAGCRLLWDSQRSTWIVAQFDADKL